MTNRRDVEAQAADEAVGATLRAIRERQRLSQPELARRMTARGWPWHQSTVHRVESGRQPLRFREGADLALILEVTMDQLAGADPEAAEAAVGEYRRKSQEVLVFALERLLEGAREL